MSRGLEGGMEEADHGVDARAFVTAIYLPGSCAEEQLPSVGAGWEICEADEDAEGGVVSAPGAVCRRSVGACGAGVALDMDPALLLQAHGNLQGVWFNWTRGSAYDCHSKTHID